MSNSHHLKKVSLDFIRYANCWEDAELLLECLAPQPGQRLLSIGSGGDNSLALLSHSPEWVVAVDVNPVQIYLLELKKAAMQSFSREDYLQFIGFRAGGERKKQFQGIRQDLPSATRAYWDENLDLIERGLVHQGKFERYLRFFAKRVLPLIHSKGKIHQLLAPKTAAAQAAFYEKKWNNLRWRLLFKVFFSKWLLGLFGRDIRFMKEVEVPVGTFLLNKTARHLRSIYAQDNFILHYAATGNFGQHLPYYVQPGIYENIQAHLPRLLTVEGLAETAIERYGPFDGFNLSNIFEYMNPQQFQQTVRQLLAGSKPGAVYTYWNLMVPRRMSEVHSSIQAASATWQAEASERDRGFFYGAIHKDQHTIVSKKHPIS